MSYKLTYALFRAMKFTATEKAVLGAMLTHVGDAGGDCWASIETLACESGAGARTVQRIIRDLERRGLLAVVGNDRKGGRSVTTRYRFLNPQACADILAAVEAAEAKSRNPVTLTPFAQELQKPCHADTLSDSQKGDTTTEKGAKSAQKGDTMTPEPVLNLSFEPVKDGRTVCTSSRRSLEQSRAVLRRIAEAWRIYWAETLPSKWPKVDKYTRVTWAEHAEKFQQFTDADYRLLDGLLQHESEDELLARWSAFIESKDNDGGDGWDEVKYPFRIFARQ